MGVLKILLSGELYKLRKYRIYNGLVRDYLKGFPHLLRVFSIHRRGFVLSDWEILNLNPEKCKGYLTTKQYNKIHPINGYYSKIIDDKMVMKYVVCGTDLDDLMPAYYYIIDEMGNIRPLMDAEKDCTAADSEDICRLLREKKKLALKMVTGSIGKGFYKLEYADGEILANGKRVAKDQFADFLKPLKNYVVCEYVTPHPDLARFWPNTANTMRYLTGQVNGEWRLLSCFIRFGSKKSGEVENYNRGGILCYVDEKGHFSGGYELLTKNGRMYSKPVTHHPDTNQLLEGDIPCWDAVEKAAQGVERMLPQTRYLGFDFVVTNENKVKLLEINSLTSLDCIQIDGSILDTPNGKWFFSSVMENQTK